jgi:hypothetical protein
MTGIAQHAHDGAATGGWFPKFLVAEQRLDRDRRRLIKIQAALGECGPLYLAGMIEGHLRNPLPADCGKRFRHGDPTRDHRIEDIGAARSC